MSVCRMPAPASLLSPAVFSNTLAAEILTECGAAAEIRAGCNKNPIGTEIRTDSSSNLSAITLAACVEQVQLGLVGGEPNLVATLDIKNAGYLGDDRFVCDQSLDIKESDLT